jgi:hypothetical protein
VINHDSFLDTKYETVYKDVNDSDLVSDKDCQLSRSQKPHNTPPDVGM